MAEKLFLTPSELDEILTDCYENRFQKITKNIPIEYQFSPYVLKNRNYLSAYFIDLETEYKYYIEYSSHNDFGTELSDFSYSHNNNIINETPPSIIVMDSNIVLIHKSIISPEQEPETEPIVVLPETELSKLKKIYFSLTLVDFETGLENMSLVDAKIMKKYFVKNASFSINDFYISLLPIAIKHKINVDKLKDFFYSKKKHLGNKEDRIISTKSQIKKLQKELLKLES